MGEARECVIVPLFGLCRKQTAKVAEQRVYRNACQPAERVRDVVLVNGKECISVYVHLPSACVRTLNGRRSRREFRWDEAWSGRSVKDAERECGRS